MSVLEADGTDPVVGISEGEEGAVAEESASTLKRRRAGKLSQLTHLINKSAAALEEGLDVETLKDLRRRILGQLKSLKAMDQECSAQCDIEGVPPPSSLKAKETSAVATMEGISAFIAEQEQATTREHDAGSVVSRASSSRSRGSNASNASRAAARDLEIANLRLSQQRAREASERLREEQEREADEARRQKRERERQRERELLEQEVEVAALRERLARAAEDDLAWERRADFDTTQDVAVVNSERVGRSAVRVDPPAGSAVGVIRAPAPSGVTAVLEAGASSRGNAEVAVSASSPRMAERDPAATLPARLRMVRSTPGAEDRVRCPIWTPADSGRTILPPVYISWLGVRPVPMEERLRL